MVKTNFYTRYNPPKSVGFSVSGISKTDQSFKDDCNINKIIERYKTVENYNAVLALQYPEKRKPTFGDFADQPDYLAAQNVISNARTLFEALPSNIRDRFANDPAKLLAFMADESNKDEAIKLGLCDPDPVEIKDLSTPEARQEATPEVGKSA